MSQPQEVFGRNVKRERKRVQLSQEALGHACDLHPTEISRLERAVREPRLNTIVKLAHALGIPPARLLDGIQ